ncbi:MAG: site-specific integrase [Lachnospiraceae bacterium]|nr:site-specific integrase [Lachnospiraceae bacterium]
MSKRGENIYKRKDGRWEGRFMAGRTENGKIIYKSVYAKSYTEVKLLLQNKRMEFQENLRQKELEAAIKETSLTDFLAEWLESIRPKIKESSYIKYNSMIKHYIIPNIGEKKLSQVSYSMLEDFTNQLLLEGGYKNSTLSSKTVNDTLTLLKSSFRYAANKYGIILCDFNQMPYHRKDGQIRVFNQQEHEQLTSYLYTHNSYRNLGILLALFTGIRVGELCALTWENIHLDSGVISICQTMQRVENTEFKSRRTDMKTRVIITSPKSSCSIREIPLPAFLIDILKNTPHSERGYFLSDSEELFIEPRNLQTHFKTVLKGAGIEDANFHALRHTFATRCVELGFDIKSLSEVLGHANVNITLNKYVHPSMELKRDNMEKLSQLL